MQRSRRIPDWLIVWLNQAMLSEIYPNIRAIAVSFSDDKELKIRYYLDRQPTQYDRESLDYVMTSVLSAASSNEDIRAVKEECVYSVEPISELDPLDGVIYARRED